MSSILFDHHLGLGDHIICSGIVREYCKSYDRVGIFCLTRNYPSVAFMYHDLPNLKIHMVSSYAQKYWYRIFNAVRIGANRYGTVRVIGTYDQELGVLFERQIYGFVGMPLAKKWDNFYLLRDTEREEALFKKVGLRPYAFVHDDNRYPIDPARLPSGLSPFRPDKEFTDNMFDYCKVIEGADEIHVIDSSFMFLVDCLPYVPDQKLVIHRYARLNTPCQMPLLKKPWTILT